MNEYIHKIEYEYNIEKHIKIVSKANKNIRSFCYVILFITMILIASVFVKYDMQNLSTYILIYILLFISFVLLLSTGKKQIRKRLLSIYGTAKITFIYEFYDEFIKIQRIGGGIEGQTNVLYSAIVNAFAVEDKIGYATLKDQSIVFICCDNTKEIVEFVKSKLQKGV